jgi:hypothetical protein
MKMDKKPQKIRIGGRSYGHHDNDATITNLLKDEVDTIEAFTLGACWIRVSDEGRIERVERFKELPPPSEDPDYPPKWVSLTDWAKEAPFLCNPVPSLPEEPKTQYDFPAIIIHSLCGYNNTPYAYEARKLQDYGFECCRSRKGPDGKFWELWYLPGTFHAQGELKEAIEAESKKNVGCDLKQHVAKENRAITAAVKFLCHHVSFGALDICYQRAAMVID